MMSNKLVLRGLRILYYTVLQWIYSPPPRVTLNEWAELHVINLVNPICGFLAFLDLILAGTYRHLCGVGLARVCPCLS